MAVRPNNLPVKSWKLFYIAGSHKSDFTFTSMWKVLIFPVKTSLIRQNMVQTWSKQSPNTRHTICVDLYLSCFGFVALHITPCPSGPSLHACAPMSPRSVAHSCVASWARRTDARGFTTTLRNRTGQRGKQKSSALSTSDKLSRCLKEQLEPYGTLLLFPDHVSLIRYLMQGTSPPSSLQRSIAWKLRPSRGPVTAPRNLTRPA